uniref:Uncharacterized protein n=1 Tax=Rhizophora mucronata TaxID=61149 RepID=A0A2P2PIW4_RHIMU
MLCEGLKFSLNLLRRATCGALLVVAPFLFCFCLSKYMQTFPFPSICMLFFILLH